MTWNYINVSDNECNSFAVIRAFQFGPELYHTGDTLENVEPILKVLRRAIRDQYGYPKSTPIKLEAIHGYHFENTLIQLRQGTFMGSLDVRVTVGENKHYITLEQTWLYMTGYDKHGEPRGDYDQ